MNLKILGAIVILALGSCLGKIKLYTIYTPSHENMYKTYFLPSVPTDCELVVAFREQNDCPTGAYYSGGWAKMMERKVDVILRGIRENRGDILVYADADIQFFRPIEEYLRAELTGYDFVAQQGWPSKTICAGFLAIRANEATKQLFEYVKAQCAKLGDDQSALNFAVKQPVFAQVKWKLLPYQLFPNGAAAMADNLILFQNSPNARRNCKRYVPGTKLVVDAGAFLHHANWCVGTDIKEQFMADVKAIVAARVAQEVVRVD